MENDGQLKGINHITERLYINGREFPVLDNPTQSGIFIDVNQSKNKPISPDAKLINDYNRHLGYADYIKSDTEKGKELKIRRREYLKRLISKEVESPYAYLYTYYPDEKSIWDDLLSNGMSVVDAVKKANMEQYMSSWFESQYSRTTVFNPAMKYSPIKLTRTSDTVVNIRMFINCFVDQVSKKEIDANQVIYYFKSLEQSDYKDVSIVGKKTNQFDFRFFVEEGMRRWEGAYRADGIDDSFGKEREVQVVVEIIVGDGREQINQQRYLSIYLVKELKEDTDGSVLGYVKSPGWSIDFYGEMNIKKLDDNDSISIIALHELGHVLGLSDATKEMGKEAIICGETPANDVMRYARGEKKVYPNDIEMILEAWKTDSKQSYMDVEFERKSAVIRRRKNDNGDIPF